MLQYVDALCRPMLPHVTAEHLASRARLRALFGEDFFLQRAAAAGAGGAAPEPELGAGLASLERKRHELRALILADVARRKECMPPPGYRQP